MAMSTRQSRKYCKKLPFLTKCGIILYMTGIVGHSQILAFFDKILANGPLSHAYCFARSESVGKRAVAEAISAKLHGVTREKLGTQPDYLIVEQVFDEKKEKTKKDISVEQIRDLREYLSRRAYLSGYKIAMIDGAEKMSLEAANALLKTLEEPKEKTILFLLTEDEAELPATILSRCQLIYFKPAASAELKNYLLEQHVASDRADEMVNLANGLPGKIVGWLADSEKYNWHLSELNRFKSLEKKSFFEKIKIVEDLFGDKTDHIAARENLQEVLNIWLTSVRESLKSNGWRQDRVLNVEKSIQDAKKMLDQNIHPRLLIENVLLMIT